MYGFTGSNPVLTTKKSINMKKKIKVWIHDFLTDPGYHIVLILSGILVYGLLACMILAFICYLYSHNL